MAVKVIMVLCLIVWSIVCAGKLAGSIQTLKGEREKNLLIAAVIEGIAVVMMGYALVQAFHGNLEISLLWVIPLGLIGIADYFTAKHTGDASKSGRTYALIYGAGIVLLLVMVVAIKFL